MKKKNKNKKFGAHEVSYSIYFILTIILLAKHYISQEQPYLIASIFTFFIFYISLILYELGLIKQKLKIK